MSGLGVGNFALNFVDFIFDMTVGHEDIHPPIQVVVKKEAAKSQCKKTLVADLGNRRLVDEKRLPFVVIECEHLVREVADHEAGPAGKIIVGRVNPHGSRSEEHTSELQSLRHLV